MESLVLEAGYMRMSTRSTEAILCQGNDRVCPYDVTRTGCREHTKGPRCAVCASDSFVDSHDDCVECENLHLTSPVTILGIVISVIGCT